METPNQTNERSKSRKKAGGLLFVGCMFLGMATGWYLGSIRIGIFAGMGIGFILSAIVIISESNKR